MNEFKTEEVGTIVLYNIYYLFSDETRLANKKKSVHQKQKINARKTILFPGMEFIYY